MKRYLKFLLPFLALMLVAAACGNDDDSAADTAEEATETTDEATDEAAGGDEEMAEADIVVTATEAGDFGTLVAAVEAAGLVETLQGPGPFTVFAPNDAAFETALSDLGVTADELLADPTLGDILTFHVVPGEVLAADVVELDGQMVETVNGATVEVGVDGDAVTVNGANVIATDVVASNGVIHVIDAVLIP